MTLTKIDEVRNLITYPIESLRGMSEKGVHFAPRYSTTDHWIQESIKQIFNSGLFWAVEAAE